MQWEEEFRYIFPHRIPLHFRFFDVIESDMKNRFTVAMPSVYVFTPDACDGVFILRAQAIIKYQN